MSAPGDDAIEAAVLRLVAARGAAKTICPSDVARDLGGPQPEDWRRLMTPVRRVAVRLAKTGAVAILRKGLPVADLDGFKGIYRIGLPRDAPDLVDDAGGVVHDVTSTPPGTIERE